MSLFRTHSEEETLALGATLARDLPKQAVVLLIGNLGAGKTALSKGILQGLGVADPNDVTSPTFGLIHEYGSGAAYHIDLYRLDTTEQVRGLGLEDLFDHQAVVLIEWGERFPALLPERRTEIRIRALGDQDREFDVQSIGGADRNRTDE